MATLIQHPDRPNRWRSWFTNWMRRTRSTRAERNKKKARWKPIRDKNHIWLGHQRSTRKIKYNFMQHCKFCQSRRCQFRQTISKILSVVSSIYNPLGFVAPFIFLAKTILQDMCRSKPRWDDQIPEDALQRWQTWLEMLPKLEEIVVDRCLKPANFGDIVSCQLHHFSDASQQGYGAVISNS